MAKGMESAPEETRAIRQVSFVTVTGNIVLCAFKMFAGIVGRSGAIALVAAVVSIAVKEAMYWYTRYYAKLLNSAAFMADAWHHHSDVFASVGSLIGIGGAMLGFPVLDAAAGVVISLFILKVASDILSDAVKRMLDTSCGEEFEEKLREYVLSQNGVMGIDVLRTRMFGNNVNPAEQIS